MGFEGPAQRTAVAHTTATGAVVQTPSLAASLIVPDQWLEDSFQRLTAKDQDLVLRHKIIPYVWLPQETIFAVLHEGAANACHKNNIAPLGRLSPQTYRRLVRKYLSKELLHRAVHSLRQRDPLASAKIRLSTPQTIVLLLTFGAFTSLSCFLSLQFSMALALGLFSLLFAAVITLRCLCLMPPPEGQQRVIRPLHDHALPIYTILVPLFRETAVAQQIVQALLSLDYPAEKLDIKIILEEHDVGMHQAVHDMVLPWFFDVIIVPAGHPQTKPRALNYAMQFSRGSLVTIYDGEDIPDRRQLRQAAAQFAQEDDTVGCMQAALNIFNHQENWLTQQFAAEYAGLFHVILPKLAAYNLPIPLGGTSNHFRSSALQAVGWWDAFNVTEDADLGFRLARHGFKIKVLQSATEEEGCCTVKAWLRQRRRWLKGFLATWFVHMRNPLQTLRELGVTAFLVMNAQSIGVFAAALLHPFSLHSVCGI